MKAIPPQAESGVREMTRVEYAWDRLKLHVWHWRLARWLPRLVWLNDEVDVTITFTKDSFEPGEPNPFRLLFGGGLHEIEKQLRNMGIGFDTGMGSGGRDWEWDWSLHGPVRVKFRGRARSPEKRVREEAKTPPLKVVS